MKGDTHIRQTFLGAIAVVLATLGLLVTLSGCDSIDPTAQAFAIDFHNDLAKTVEIKSCGDDSCDSFNYSDTIDPGDLHSENISDRNVLRRWLVADEDGNTLGCLPLQFEQKESDVVVDVSRAVPCPGSRPLKVHGAEQLGRE